MANIASNLNLHEDSVLGNTGSLLSNCSSRSREPVGAVYTGSASAVKLFAPRLVRGRLSDSSLRIIIKA